MDAGLAYLRHTLQVPDIFEATGSFLVLRSCGESGKTWNVTA